MTRLRDEKAGCDFRQTFLEHYLAPAWAQSWSFNPGSDTLLRAYSRVLLDELEGRNTDPRNEGVTVTTTPRRLMRAMSKWAKDGAKYHFVIARALYGSEAQIHEWVGNVVRGPQGPRFFQSVEGRADSLLWKRDYFRHEEEVRLICIKREPTVDEGKLKHFQFDPNETISGMSFDPRLRRFEQLEREAVVRGLGYTGPVTEDSAYHRIILDIQMTTEWPDPA
ncbi:hypothetical protein [Novosphingobium mathurense]|nr:hypothetical protein [Novosphingobium mathurense]